MTFGIPYDRTFKEEVTSQRRAATERPHAQNAAGCRRGVELERVMGATDVVGAHRVRRGYSRVDPTSEASEAS